MPTVAIDVTGGHAAPEAPVQAAAAVSRSTDIDVALVGPAARIQDLLSACSYNPEQIQIVDIDGDADAVLERCVALVTSGEADTLVTAGHAPSALRACIRGFRLLPGVTRAPLAAVVPTSPRPGNRDPFALLLDIGAALRPSADDLVAWARMGAAYAARISRVDAPTVGLLSTGRSPLDGPPEVVLAHERLRNDPTLRFVGNVEGIDIPRGAADVVVCDGFTGQVLIGVLGGVSDALLDAARGAWDKRLAWRMGLRLLEGAVVRFKELTDHDDYGGAPLLGFDHTAILALPTSGAATLAKAVKLAAKAVREDVVSAVARSL